MRIIKMKYFYGMRLRGFSPGCQPMDGFIRRLDSHSKNYHDIIVYDKALSEQNVKHFSLTPLYGYQYTNNLGDDQMYAFENLEDTVKDITATLQFAYDEYCEQYPDCDVTWLNRYLDCSNTSEVYVPDSDCYTRCEISAPVEPVSEYIEKESKKPIRIGSIVFRLEGVNCLDNEDVNMKVAFDDDEAYSFKDRYSKAIEELTEETKGMTLSEAQEHFKGKTEDDLANYYGDWIFVYTKEFNKKYLSFGVRMD
jgi:hypothetical protein